MTNLLLPHPSILIPLESGTMIAAGAAADGAASRYVFADYRARKSANTIRRHDDELALFARCLDAIGVSTGDFAADPDAWRGVTWGLVTVFQQWLLSQGYAVSSVNVRVSTIKTYAKLAFRAGTIDQTTYALIQAVTGYSRKEQKRVDEGRETTRIGTKKADSIVLSVAQSRQLKHQPDTPTGRRDSLLMCILLDHGLRCGEVALLRVEHFDLARGTLTFYRPKVDKEQTHTMSDDTKRSLRAYLDLGGPASGLLLHTTRKGGFVVGQGMVERVITGRVAYLGRRAGIIGLSAHDCRHTWATLAARAGTPLDRLMDAGGWSSMAMPLRYVETAKIANDGVILEERRNVY